MRPQPRTTVLSGASLRLGFISIAVFIENLVFFFFRQFFVVSDLLFEIVFLLVCHISSYRGFAVALPQLVIICSIYTFSALDLFCRMSFIAALMASSASTEQCILTGGSASSSAIAVFLICSASAMFLTFYPLCE